MSDSVRFPLRASGVFFGIFKSAPLSLLLRFSLAALLLWSANRLLLGYWHGARVSALDALPQILGLGLRVDLITLGWALAIPVLSLPLTVLPVGARLWLPLSRVWLAAFFVLGVLLEATSLGFMQEYELRPNHLFLDYLDRPQEVLPMLWGGFRALLIAGLVVTFAAALLIWRWLRPATAPAFRWQQLWLWPLLVMLCALMIRSSLQHRPANPAFFARWEDSLVNQLVLNGMYTTGYAVYGQRHETDVNQIYGKLSDDALFTWLRGDERYAGSPASHPTWRHQSPGQPREKSLNLILVVQESLGAGFSAKLGGADRTPNMDRWAERGWWFEQLFATGTRSARGLEAIVAGFPPSPAQSVLKRERSQRGFSTLASVLGEAGYHSEFIYGGESHFDNMRSFFLGNGFKTVIDQNDYTDPVFRGSWGVSDEDLFNMTQQRALQLHASGQPFFQLVFTSSNHTPFEYPPERIQPVGDDPNTVDNAVLYADYAVGQFLEQASRSPYFANTLVLVVADHDVRVYGDEVVPVSRFHIPGLLVGANLPPKKIQSLASQIDLAPTLLSLMGVEAEFPFPGRDLTRSLPEFGAEHAPPPRALIQFNDTFARYEGDLLDVLLPGGEARRYRVQGPKRLLERMDAPDAQARQRLLAEVLLPGWLYEHAAYGRPDGLANENP